MRSTVAGIEFELTVNNFMDTDFPFRDPTLPRETRIEDLLGRLTLEEKTAQLRYDAPAIERLGISAYNWWNECLHGVARNGRATVFPQAINLAATWDKRLVNQVASAISDEARAKHHAAASRGSHQQYQGLTFWTPNINIFRDPRWGRGQETWGEDVCLTSEMASAMVRGLQGDDSENLKVAACAKHFAVHSGPEAERHHFDACPSEEDFWDTYLPAFERLVSEGVETVMPAYNRTYGAPCAGSELLLQEILREQWGFQGHVVSDCWAIRDFHTTHKVTDTAEESATMALKAGTDLNCGSVYCDALDGALALKLITEEDVDRSLRRLLRTRFKLGMFDGDQASPYARIPMSVVNSEAHRELALKTATDSIVLLKNADQCLPISEGIQSMLIVGPNASNIDCMLGNYHGLSSQVSTLVEGIMGRVPEGVKIDYRLGTPLDQPSTNDLDWAIFEAAKCDYVVAAMGISPILEGEEGDALRSDNKGDRHQIELPKDQTDFLTRLHKRLREDNSHAKLIVVLFGGAAMAIPEIHEFSDAVLQVWYPGERGGEAIASVLWGDAAPGGRMPVTTPRSTDCLPAFDDYSLEGRTYRFMQDEAVLYPFGFGLNFGKVAWRNVSTPSSLPVGSPVEITLELSNQTAYPAKEVIQIYLRSGKFAQRLVGFDVVHLEPNTSRQASIRIQPQSLTRLTPTGRKPLTGDFELIVASCAPCGQSQNLGSTQLYLSQLELISQ